MIRRMPQVSSASRPSSSHPVFFTEAAKLS